MKKKEIRSITLLLTLMIVLMNLFAVPAFAAPGDVAINEINFPDSNFRGFVKLNYDKNNDNILQRSERDAVTEIDLYDTGASDAKSLKGIEHFTKLKVLGVVSCYKLTALDVSKNHALEKLECYANDLTTLDLSKNPALKDLSCESIDLRSLDLSNNPALTDLSCSNNQLTALDLSQCPALEKLDCRSNNMTELDVSKNPKLETLWCDENQLTALELSNNLALTDLSCSNNQLTALDPRQCPALKNIDCSNNKLTTLDFSKNPSFFGGNLSNNRLTNLDLTKNKGAYIQGDHQVYDIEVDESTMSLNLKSLPGNFDPSKVEGLDGASGIISGNTLKLASTKPNQVTYTYRLYDYNDLPATDLDFNHLSVTLNVNYRDEVEISFDKNGGSGTMEDVMVFKNSTYKLPASGFTAPEGKEFKAWEVGGVEKAVGDSITVNADTTVKAIWKDKTAAANKSVITVNPAGGKWADGTTTPKTYAIEAGKYFTLPEAPIREGYTFRYWKGSRYNPGDKYKVTGADHTFAAVWEKNGVSDKTSPKTGDNSMPCVYALGLIMAACGMLVLNAKRSKNK